MGNAQDLKQLEKAIAVLTRVKIAVESNEVWAVTVRLEESSGGIQSQGTLTVDWCGDTK